MEFALAPPSRFYAAVSSWLTVFRRFWHLAIFALHWLPVAGFVIGIIVIVTDPGLLLTGFWKALRVVPSAIRYWLAASPPAATAHPHPPPEFMQNLRLLEAADVSPPQVFAHPSMLPTPATSPLGLVLSVLSAQGGGAGLFWMYANRAALFGGAARAT